MVNAQIFSLRKKNHGLAKVDNFIKLLVCIFLGLHVGELTNSMKNEIKTLRFTKKVKLAMLLPELKGYCIYRRTIMWKTTGLV